MDFIKMASPPENMSEATEAEFLARIELDMSRHEHRALYSAMKAIAADVIGPVEALLTPPVRLRSVEAGNEPPTTEVVCCHF